MPNRFLDPQHWRDRAEEARAHAEQVRDLEAKRLLLSIAETYDRLVEHAERLSETAARGIASSSQN